MPADVAAIVPAAGNGLRFGGSLAKTFVPLLGEPMLLYTLRALERASSVRWIIVAAKESAHAELETLIRQAGLTKTVKLCIGGASRAESVSRGFAVVPPEAKWVLVHDAARPCLTSKLVDQTVASAREHGAVACGLPASVTVKAVDETLRVRLTLDRDHLWFVQTPQVFRRDWFAQALERAQGQLGSFPDDASLLEWAGFPVKMVQGETLNLKVTLPEDRLLAEAILSSRVGHTSARSALGRSSWRKTAARAA